MRSPKYRLNEFFGAFRQTSSWLHIAKETESKKRTIQNHTIEQYNRQRVRENKRAIVKEQWVCVYAKYIQKLDM